MAKRKNKAGNNIPYLEDHSDKYNNSTVGRTDVPDAYWYNAPNQVFDKSTLNKPTPTTSTDTIVEHKGTGKTVYKDSMSKYTETPKYTEDYTPKNVQTNEIPRLDEQWLNTDYKMTKDEKKQAKQLLNEYDAKNINVNVGNHSQATLDEAEKMSALRDKVRTSDAAIYGSMNALPGVDALMRAGNKEYYGWTTDQLREEAQGKALTDEQKAQVAEIDNRMAQLEKRLSKGSGATGDVAVDEAMGLLGQNTAQESQSIREELSALERAKYVAMLGSQNDGYTYTERKENAQTQNPLAYTAGDLATRTAETIAMQNALGGTGYGKALDNFFGDSVAGKVASDVTKDMPVDVLTDTLPEYLTNKASGMTTSEADAQAINNLALNLGINVGVAGLQNLGDIISEIRTKAKDLPIENEVEQIIENATKNGDNIVKQAEPEIPFTEPDIDVANRGGNYENYLDSIAKDIDNDIDYRNVTEEFENGTPLHDTLVADAKASEEVGTIPKVEKVPEIQNEVPALKEKISKARTNTFARDAISDEIQKGNMPEELYKHASISEQASMGQAAGKLQDFQACEAEYLGDISKRSMNSVDADTMFGMYKQYANEQRIAREAGDLELAEELQRKINRITKNIQSKGTEAGQFTQAFAKYTRDADGAILNAQLLGQKQADEFIKNNPKVANQLDNFKNELSSNDIWKQLTGELPIDDVDISDATDSLDNYFNSADLKIKLREGVDKAISGIESKKLRKNYERLADKITDSLVNAKKQGEDLMETLNQFDDMAMAGYAGISDETRETVEHLFSQAEKLGYNSKERVQLENEAYALLANDLNLYGSFEDKVNSWRYFAMLLNPKTHIRNVIGNSLFGEVTKIKDAVANGIEAVVDKATKGKAFSSANYGDIDANRTKSILNPFNSSDRALKQAAKENADDVYRILSDGNKYYSTERSIKANAPVFKNKVLNKLVGINGDLLNYEDEKALYKKYSQALSGYLKANGADSSIFKATDDASLDLLTKAQAYAIDEAQKATFHQMSKFADSLGEFSRNLMHSQDEELGKRLAKKMAGGLIEGTVPFKKTPINILKTAAAYSPLNVVTVAGDMQKVAKGTMSASKMIDDLAKGVTGSGLLLGGYMLAKAGILNGSDTSKGNQAYSINVGDGSYTIDGFAPVSIPLLVGAELYDTFEKKGGKSLNDVFTVLSSVGDPLVETTMLQGIANLLAINKYSSDDTGLSALGNVLATSATSYLTQFIPTELGNIARTIDDTLRSSYTGKTGLENLLGKVVNKTKNRIPFLSETSQPYMDNWGEERKQVGDSLVSRFVYQHLSPGYYQETDNSPRATELRRLSQETGDEDVVNKGVGTSVTIDGVKTKLSPEELTAYSDSAGTYKAQLVDSFMNSEAYKSLSDEERKNVINDIYNLSNKLGQNDALNLESDEASDYKEYGADATLDNLVTKATLKSYGFSNTEANRELLQTQGIEALQEKQALKDELGQIQKGVDSKGNPTYYSLADTKAANIYQETGNENLVNAYTQLSQKGSTLGNKISYLEDSGFSDDDKGYLLQQTVNLTNKAKEMAQSGNYTDLYRYYAIRNAVDQNGNNKVDKKEIPYLRDYLAEQNYNQNKIDEIVGWY